MEFVFIGAKIEEVVEDAMSLPKAIEFLEQLNVYLIERAESNVYGYQLTENKQCLYQGAIQLPQKTIDLYGSIEEQINQSNSIRLRESWQWFAPKLKEELSRVNQKEIKEQSQPVSSPKEKQEREEKFEKLEEEIEEEETEGRFKKWMVQIKNPKSLKYVLSVVLGLEFVCLMLKTPLSVVGIFCFFAGVFFRPFEKEVESQLKIYMSSKIQKAIAEECLCHNECLTFHLKQLEKLLKTTKKRKKQEYEQLKKFKEQLVNQVEDQTKIIQELSEYVTKLEMKNKTQELLLKKINSDFIVQENSQKGAEK